MVCRLCLHGVLHVFMQVRASIQDLLLKISAHFGCVSSFLFDMMPRKSQPIPVYSTLNSFLHSKCSNRDWCLVDSKKDVSEKIVSETAVVMCVLFMPYCSLLPGHCVELWTNTPNMIMVSPVLTKQFELPRRRLSVRSLKSSFGIWWWDSRTLFLSITERAAAVQTV